MTTLRKRILTGLAVLGIATTTLAVQAQSAQPQGVRQGSTMSPEHSHIKLSERRAERQKKLHDMLKLTPSQHAAWTTWLGAAGPAKAAAERGQQGERRSMAAPERMAQRIEMGKQRLARMETRLAALNTFYAVLTAEQQQVFDEQSMRHGKRGRHHGEHRMRRSQLG